MIWDRQRIRNLEVRNLIVVDTLTMMVNGQQTVVVPPSAAPAAVAGSVSAPTSTPAVSSVAGRTGAIVLSTNDVGGLATVATTGAYQDLTGRPTFATVATTGAYSDLTGAPTLAPVATAGSYASLTGKPTLATVAATGAYSDLTGKPTLGTLAGTSPTGTASTSTYLRGDGSWSPLPTTTIPVTSVAGRTGAIVLSTADVGGLATVASSGAYGDLSGKPTIPAVVGGKVAITGTGTVASGLSTITGVVACLGQDPSLTGLRVTATWSGNTITLKVWKPTSALDSTPLASTVATTVNWIALGS